MESIANAVVSATTDVAMSNDADGSINVTSAPPSFDDFDRVETTREEVKKFITKQARIDQASAEILNFHKKFISK